MSSSKTNGGNFVGGGVQAMVTFSSQTSVKVLDMINSGAASDENVITVMIMSTIHLQWSNIKWKIYTYEADACGRHAQYVIQREVQVYWW